MRLIAIARHGEEQQGSPGMEAHGARPLSDRRRARAEAAGRPGNAVAVVGHGAGNEDVRRRLGR